MCSILSSYSGSPYIAHTVYTISNHQSITGVSLETDGVAKTDFKDFNTLYIKGINTKANELKVNGLIQLNTSCYFLILFIHFFCQFISIALTVDCTMLAQFCEPPCNLHFRHLCEKLQA